MQLRNRQVPPSAAAKPVDDESQGSALSPYHRQLTGLAMLHMCDATMACMVLITHQGQPALEQLLVIAALMGAQLWRTFTYWQQSPSVLHQRVARVGAALRWASYVAALLYALYATHYGVRLSLSECGMALMVALGLFQVHYLGLPALMPQLATSVFFHLLLSALFTKTRLLNLTT